MPQTKTPPKGRWPPQALMGTAAPVAFLACPGRWLSDWLPRLPRFDGCSPVIILALLAMPCQALAQEPTPDELRETIQRLRQCRIDRDRIADLEAEAEQLRGIAAMIEDAYKMRLEAERRARELDAREAGIEARELSGQLAAWQARSRDQSEIIKELSKHRVLFWWGPIPCFWLCSKSIETREIPEP